jgi:hypothetical protein
MKYSPDESLPPGGSAAFAEKHAMRTRLTERSQEAERMGRGIRGSAGGRRWQGGDGRDLGWVGSGGARVVPAFARSGGLGVEPGTEAEAKFRDGAAGFSAECGATGVVGVGLDRSGAQTG